MDIRGIAELRGIREERDATIIGALIPLRRNHVEPSSFVAPAACRRFSPAPPQLKFTGSKSVIERFPAALLSATRPRSVPTFESPNPRQ